LKGFGPSKFAPTVNPETGQAYDYGKDSFAATAYQLSTDQLGTQLDPRAHWNPDFPSIDELPPTFAVRPLVVISIVDQVAKDPKYALQVQDILHWEKNTAQFPKEVLSLSDAIGRKSGPTPRSQRIPISPACRSPP
jgi:kynurenine formamidase